MVLVKKIEQHRGGKMKKDGLKDDHGFKLWLKICTSFFSLSFSKGKTAPDFDILVISDTLCLPSVALKAAFPSSLPLVRLNVDDRSKRQQSVNVNNRLNAVWLWRLNHLFYSFISSVHVTVLTEMNHNQS